MRTRCPTCLGRFDEGARYCPFDGTRLALEGGLPPGTRLPGDLEVRELLGEGAMGAVYRGWQRGPDRPVAIKVLLEEWVDNPSIVKRFEREARAVARLDHPGIVAVYAVGETDRGVPFLVMEHVAGESLAARLAREGTLAPARAVDVARQVAGALEAAHAAGIVHRDLKPENLLLAGDRVKVVDFGIAKVEALDGCPGDSLSRAGAVLGTPHYIAPEQAAGAEVDGRADVYALGVVLYRMLTGRVPFQGSAIAVLAAHVNEPPPRPRELRPDLDPALEAVVLRAMAKDPAGRYGSARELGAALAAVAGGLADGSTLELAACAIVVDPGASGADRTIPAAGARRSRRRGGLAGMAVAAALLALLAAAPGVGEAPAGEAPRAVEPAPATAIEEPAAIATRTITLGERGYSARITFPEAPVAGVPFELVVEAWAPDGRRYGGEALPLSIAHPAAGKRTLALPATGEVGVYRGAIVLEAAGSHHVHVYPVPGRPAVRMWFDVEVARAPEA